MAVVSLKAVFEQLVETHELPKKQMQAVQADLVSALTQHLKQGAQIRLSSLGTLEVRHRAARMWRNPEALNIRHRRCSETSFTGYGVRPGISRRWYNHCQGLCPGDRAVA